MQGGAVALGHAIGSSGSRVLTTLIYALRRLGKQRGDRDALSRRRQRRRAGRGGPVIRDRRDRRRRHDGQRHRPDVCAGRVRCRAARCRRGVARSRQEDDREEPREVRREGQADDGRSRRRAWPNHRWRPISARSPAVDYVVEAIVEDLAAKRALFSTLDTLTRPDVMLTSNTSSISITSLGRGHDPPGSRARDALHESGAADDAGGTGPRAGDVGRVDAGGGRRCHRRSARRRSKPPTTPASSPIAS